MPGPREFRVEFPVFFEECDWQTIEAKGWLTGVVVVARDRRSTVTFYEPVRLGQTIEDDLSTDAIFFERNLIVLPSVTRRNMEAALDRMAIRNELWDLVPDGG
ncbi:hypothetical protein ABI59_14135 [Acidobacteria bacterium Mor1]|nr:hypothetical protein ABI59_14135 [Acidobacteria bacterium Mor1]